MRRILIHIEGLKIGHGKKVLYENIAFDIHEGDCIMLCGANGSGKTTLLKAIADLQGTESRITMIPSRIPKVKGFSVKDFIKVSCFKQTDMAGKLSEHDANTLGNALEKLGIAHLKDRDISTLSDGEFQKSCIAASLVQHAEVILLDEPTAFLDAENKTSVLQALRGLCEEKDSPAVIFSTHDLHEGLKACNRVIALGADGVLRITSMAGAEEAVQGIFRKGS
jgi:iron complex transport system ATP-binding protein